MADEIFDITIPRGTIIKVSGYPVKLKENIYIKKITENEFALYDHEIMDYDYFENNAEKVDKETLDIINNF